MCQMEVYHCPDGFTIPPIQSYPPLSAVPPTSQTDDNDSGNPSQVQSALQSTSHQAHKLFGFMKDGAGKLFKNIKDSSSTVINQVARWVGMKR